MTRPVVWRPSASADLRSLYDWIAAEAGRDAAFRYTEAIGARTALLADCPGLGSPRPDLGPGIRTVAHRRRTVIAYLVTDDAVEIVALAHGGRDLAGRFADDED